MGAQGDGVLNFGAFPGSSVAYVDVTATGVVSTSKVEAWINPVASADHTDTDHIAAQMKVVGTYLSDNNLRIYGLNTNDVIPPLEPQPHEGMTSKPRGTTNRVGRQNAPMLVGQFNVNWVWN